MRSADRDRRQRRGAGADPTPSWIVIVSASSSLSQNSRVLSSRGWTARCEKTFVAYVLFLRLKLQTSIQEIASDGSGREPGQAVEHRLEQRAQSRALAEVREDHPWLLFESSTTDLSGSGFHQHPHAVLGRLHVKL